MSNLGLIRTADDILNDMQIAGSLEQKSKTNLEITRADAQLAVRIQFENYIREVRLQEQTAKAQTQQAAVAEEKNKEKIRAIRIANHKKQISDAQLKSFTASLQGKSLDDVMAISNDLFKQLNQAIKAVQAAQQQVAASTLAVQANAAKADQAMQQLIARAKSKLSPQDAAILTRAASRMVPIATIVERTGGNVSAGHQLANLGLRILLEPESPDTTESSITPAPLPMPRPEFANREVPEEDQDIQEIIDISNEEDDDYSGPADRYAALLAKLNGPRKVVVDAALDDETSKEFNETFNPLNTTIDANIADKKAATKAIAIQNEIELKFNGSNLMILALRQQQSYRPGYVK